MCVRDIAMHVAIDIPPCLLSNTTTTSHIPTSISTSASISAYQLLLLITTGFIVLVDGLEQCVMIH